MRAMLVLVVAMGVLIVAGVAVVAVTIVGRLGHGAPAAEVVLDQPAGTRIVSVAGVGNRMAVVLQGGGPDRVLVLTVGPVRLSH